MPLLKPIIDPAIDKILSESGISPRGEVKDALARNGLSIPELVQELAFTIRTSENHLKQRAIETALKLHDTIGERNAPTVVFQVDNQNIQINQILCPKRD